jgi:ABC-type oligopeptide transport system substrate-binding subunit
MKEQLSKVGIPVTLREMEWGTFLKATDNKEIDLFHMRWSADYLDPQNFLSLLLTSGSPENRTGYTNKEYDAMCAAADSERDSAKRMALYAKAERFVVDDAPWVPIYFQKDLELVKPWVKGIKDSLMGHLPHKTTTVE